MLLPSLFGDWQHRQPMVGSVGTVFKAHAAVCGTLGCGRVPVQVK